MELPEAHHGPLLSFTLQPILGAEGQPLFLELSPIVIEALMQNTGQLQTQGANFTLALIFFCLGFHKTLCDKQEVSDLSKAH